MDTVNLAHPAFIQIIERLTPDEALLLSAINGRNIIPFGGLKANLHEGGHNTIIDTCTDLISTPNLGFPQSVPTYLDNLTSVGILNKDSGTWLVKDEPYNQIADIYAFNALEEAIKENPLFSSIERSKGIYTITEFGKSFIKACLNH